MNFPELRACIQHHDEMSALSLLDELERVIYEFANECGLKMANEQMSTSMEYGWESQCQFSRDTRHNPQKIIDTFQDEYRERLQKMMNEVEMEAILAAD